MTTKQSPRDRASAIVIPLRYTQQIKQARVDGFLTRDNSYGQGKVHDIWLAVCKAEQRAFIDLHTESASLKIDIRHLGNAILTHQKVIQAILAEHFELARCGIDYSFSIGKVQPDVARHVARQVKRLSAVLTAVQP